MATDIKSNMEKEFDQTIKECTNIPLDSDLSKKEALRILVEESKLLQLVDKRSTDKEDRERRKEHEYFLENQEKEKNNLEKERLAFDKDKSLRNETLEKEKLDLEKENLKWQKELRKQEGKDRILTTCLTIGCTLVSTMISVLVPVLVARKQFYVMARMNYIDEGRVCPELKDSAKMVQKFVGKR